MLAMLPLAGDVVPCKGYPLEFHNPRSGFVYALSKTCTRIVFQNECEDTHVQWRWLSLSFVLIVAQKMSNAGDVVQRWRFSPMMAMVHGVFYFGRGPLFLVWRRLSCMLLADAQSVDELIYVRFRKAQRGWWHDMSTSL